MRVVVEADGGSRGNPGPAGYGAVVLDASSGAVLAERLGALGVATNNVAEYRGLLAGLEAARDLGAREVEVRMDSKLVVEQMSGRWQIKHPALKPLAAQAAALVRELGAVRFGWVPRARNARADALANRAMDEAAGGPDGPRTGRSVAGSPAPGATFDPTDARDPRTRNGDDRDRDDRDRGTPEPAAAPPTATGPGESAAWTGQAGAPTRLLLLRHGQTELSVQRRYSGHGDPPLTEVGVAQAKAAAARIAGLGGVAAVLTSPLRRARATAEAVAAATGAPLRVRQRLIETDFGEWEGLTFAEARARDPRLHGRWLGHDDIAPPGGESFAAVERRVAAERASLQAGYPGVTVVVVSHVTPIKMLLRAALGAGPEVLYRLHLDLASLSVAEFYPDGGTSVRLVNDISHHP